MGLVMICLKMELQNTLPTESVSMCACLLNQEQSEPLRGERLVDDMIDDDET